MTSFVQVLYKATVYLHLKKKKKKHFNMINPATGLKEFHEQDVDVNSSASVVCGSCSILQIKAFL